MSKIIITSSSNKLDSPFDRRCGRAAWFCIYDDHSQDIIFIENKHLNLKEHIGLKVVEDFINLNINKIISGDFGAKVQDSLKKANIQMVIIEDQDYTIEDIVNLIKMNK